VEYTKRGSEFIPNITKRFDVDFETGTIINKKTGKEMIGTDSYGYIQCSCGSIDGKRKMIKGHQIVYLLYHGELPEYSIDHFDRVKTHNWISNLRPSDPSKQGQNRGCTGVRKRGKYYRARVRLPRGKQIETTFDNKEDAEAWVKRKRKELW
jgi:hypothetical protein